MDSLPFQPEERDLLEKIIDKAMAFRDFLRPWTSGERTCSNDEDWAEMIFYLRKLEGAQILLTSEHNIFRQLLYRYKAPAGASPPPILSQSLSTRKPRPTKQQRLSKCEPPIISKTNNYSERTWCQLARSTSTSFTKQKSYPKENVRSFSITIRYTSTKTVRW